MATDRSPIDVYLERFSGVQLATLESLRDTLRGVLPAADEQLKYGMPCFVVRGKGVAGFDGFKEHCGYFPMSGGVIQRVAALPAWCSTTKGGLQFPVDRRLPAGLVHKLVRARLDEISEVSDGKRMEFYDDGTLKAEGGMKDGQLNGKWRWYRKDGTLMRTGQFRMGDEVGTWETWDADGNLVERTRHR